MPKFSTIFFANLAEISLDLVKYMTASAAKAEISEDHCLCDRFVFSLDDNSILITPYKLNPEFFKDSCSLLKLKNILNLSPKSVGESLCQSVQKDNKLFSYLKEIIKNNSALKLISYAATPQFFDVLDKLTSEGLVFSSPEVPQPSSRWTQEFFGSKAGFRQTSTTLGKNFPPMPAGKICHDKNEIITQAAHFLKETGGCILKTNHGLAGAGLRIIPKKEADQNPEKFVAKVIASEKYFQHYPIVVEQFIPPDLSLCGGAPNIELCIKDGKIVPLYVCGMRVSSSGIFNGVEIGPTAVSQNIKNILTKAGKSFGQTLQKNGYQGYFEIDWVAGTDGKVYPIEANLRRTGGTHVYDLGKTLLGDSFSKFYLTANNNLFCQAVKDLTYQQLKVKLSPILYPLAGQKKGLILTVVSNLTHGRVGFIAIGKNRQETLAIEDQFQQRIQCA